MKRYLLVLASLIVALSFMIESDKEKTEALKAKIKKAMNYPMAVVAVAIIVSAILLVKVVPQFKDVFDGFVVDRGVRQERRGAGDVDLAASVHFFVG